MIIVGLEFEWSQTGGDDLGEGECVVIGDVRRVCTPALATGMGNLLLQTPRGLLPVQLYATVGAGAYRARYEAVDENDYGFGTNLGGGGKIELIGPLAPARRLPGLQAVGGEPRRYNAAADLCGGKPGILTRDAAKSGDGSTRPPPPRSCC